MIGPIKTVGIYVEDQAKSLKFYTEKMGFELRRTIDMGNGSQWLEVSPPGAQTSFVLYPKAMMENWETLKPSIVFTSEDVETEITQLETLGVKITMKPSKMAWGWFAMFADLDGNEFGLTSQPIA